eukprot:COSAG01_NODE_398_length_17547_cov_206.793501_2_plen_180_part_00
MNILNQIPLQYLYPLHVVFMTFWIAGLFFIGRMFVYDQQAEKEESSAKEAVQKLCRSAINKTLYIIVWPSLIFTFTFGISMMIQLQAYKQGWFHSKMLFVILLVAYTFFANSYKKKMLKGHSMSGMVLRMVNEVPGLLLIMIVFTVYVKNVFAGLSATAVFAFLIMLTVMIMKMMKRKA